MAAPRPSAQHSYISKITSDSRSQDDSDDESRIHIARSDSGFNVPCHRSRDKGNVIEFIFVICCECTDVICFDNESEIQCSSISISSGKFTKCMSCRSYNSTRARGRSYQGTHEIFMNPRILDESAISKVSLQISGTPLQFNTTSSGCLSYSPLEGIVDQYTQGYKVRSVNVAESRLEPYIKAGFL